MKSSSGIHNLHSIRRASHAYGIKTAYDYKEMNNLVDDVTHDTVNYLNRQQRRFDYELTEDGLFTMAVDHIYDLLDDGQLVDMYAYFNGTSLDELNDEQAASVLDVLADMSMSYFDESGSYGTIGRRKTSAEDYATIKGDFGMYGYAVIADGNAYYCLGDEELEATLWSVAFGDDVTPTIDFGEVPEDMEDAVRELYKIYRVATNRSAMSFGYSSMLDIYAYPLSKVYTYLD